MQLQLTQKSSWRGDLLVVLVPAGAYKEPVNGVPMPGLKVGDDVGEITLVRTEEGQFAVVSTGKADKAVLDTYRRVGGRLATWLDKRERTKAGVDVNGIRKEHGDEAVGAFSEGLVLGGFQFDAHKSDAKPRRKITVDLLLNRVSKGAGKAVDRAVTVAEATNVARAVAHQPPNIINPVTLAAEARKLATRCKLKYSVLDEKQMKKAKMGGILAVGGGSSTPPRLIVLEHRGTRGRKPVVLVGKAITFDTGGYSIKPKDGILGMKYDKCGAMAVLGVMQAVSAMKLRTPVVGILAAAENMISGDAYRPDDIITTLAGKTVEIVSADAEGRMVLCDALTYAQQQYSPRAVIDVATLTGGVIIALGNLRAGLFTNDDKLRDALLASGDRTHERLWPLPLDDEYLELLKGTDSDLRNSGVRPAHAIQGGIFLKQFIESGTKWAHLDIAGVADVDKDQPYCPKGATGFGVRLLTDFIEHQRG